jgi:Ni/Co efflux regulator RcnB
MFYAILMLGMHGIRSGFLLQITQHGRFTMNTLIKGAGLVLLASAFLAGPVSASKPEDKGGKPATAGHSAEGKSKGGKPADGKHDDAKYKSDKSKGNDGYSQLRYAGIDHNKVKQYSKQYNVGGYKPLPPGIRKNLARGKPIPPGIAKTRLPQGYVNQLPRYNGYEWRGYGSDLVLVNTTSQIIADVIMDALR